MSKANVVEAPRERQGWVLLIMDNELHYFLGKHSLCGLFVPAISDEDYESHNLSCFCNCWLCEQALDMFAADIKEV